MGVAATLANDTQYQFSYRAGSNWFSIQLRSKPGERCASARAGQTEPAADARSRTGDRHERKFITTDTMVTGCGLYRCGARTGKGRAWLYHRLLQASRTLLCTHREDIDVSPAI